MSVRRKLDSGDRTLGEVRKHILRLTSYIDIVVDHLQGVNTSRSQTLY